ncbi:MAG: pilin [Candidatus Roizmanbacteria bacterium]|nr:pilin [Candidatus Roizmanbacteria bacterium]
MKKIKLLFVTSGYWLMALGYLLVTSGLHHVYAATPSPFYGDVDLPDYLDRFVTAGQVQGGALVVVFNIFLRLILVIAGFFAIWKFIEAGYSFMNAAGQPEKITEARDKITFTVVGLLVMASALVLAGVIGLIFYQDATAIISPKIIGAPTP